ncbi:MAG: DegV family protein [Dehalococcoidia bacterium]|nr:DegV family protein [Dehalococcoidia bacterium]
MGKVTIITDSSACLPKELVDKYGVLVVPMRLIIQGQTYRDGVDITPGKVYNLQRSSRVLPTTSAPSPAEFLEAYRSASETSDALLSIAISHKLSMVFESAIKAKEMAQDTIPGIQIEVLDAQTAAGAHGLLVLAAARVIASGGSLAEAVHEIERVFPKLNLIAAVDTLYFLAKSGRVPQATAWASSLLSIKPILQVRDGSAIPLQRIRTKSKAMKRLIEIMEERSGRKRMHINIMHAGVPEEAETLRKRVLERFECAELYVTEFTPVMGVHTGPGLVGLAFYAD